MDVPRYYRILQILPEADPEVVAAAYRALARKHHPDMEGGDARIMREINEAWEVLQNGAMRAAYNEKHGFIRHDAQPGTQASTAPATSMAPPAAGPLAARRVSTSTESLIDFGRYEGWRLDDLVRHDRGYVEWLARTQMGMRFRAEIYKLLAGHA